MKNKKWPYYKILHQSKNSAPGVDTIPWRVVKMLHKDLHTEIIKIYENCLNFGIYPLIWKESIIVTIPKQNADHHKVQNYQPITYYQYWKNFWEVHQKQTRETIGKNHKQTSIWIPSRKINYAPNRNFYF